MPQKCRERQMIVVDDRDPEGELPPPFPARNINVKQDVDMHTYYDIKEEIGRGRFGTVYLVEDKATKQKFAAKFVNTKRNQDRTNVGREVEIMKSLNSECPHPRLIQLYDAFDMVKEMCLVLEIVDGGELFERVINDDFILSEKACTVFIRQICQGVEFIHSKNILHLDMKPENILCLSREGNRVKICDFGLARRYDPRKKLQVLFGTPEFVAPEVVNFEPISFGTDMWSVGVICYVLLSGLSPFMGHNYVETMTNVTHNKYDFEDEAFKFVSDEAKEFIQKLLVLDKSLRLTPAQCLRDDWLKKPPTCALQRSHRKQESDSESDYDSEYEETDSDESIFEVNIVNKEKENENDRKKQEDELIKEVEAKRKELEKQVEDRKKELEQLAEAKKREDELQRTKAQLKEFVERWNSHPNSPYLVGTPIPLDLQKLVKTGGWNSRASLASIGVAPPSEPADLSHLDEDDFTSNALDDATAQGALVNDTDNQEEFTMYTIEPPPSLTKQPSPEEVAKELEVKLTQLQLEDTVRPSKETNTEEGLQDQVVPNMSQATVDERQEEFIKSKKMQNEMTNKQSDTVKNSKETTNVLNERQPKGSEIINQKKDEQKKTSRTGNKKKEIEKNVIVAPQKMNEDQMEEHKKGYEEHQRVKNTDQPKVTDNQQSKGNQQNKDAKENPKAADKKVSKVSKSNISQEPLEAERIISDILNVDHKRAYEEYKRMVNEAQKMKTEQQKSSEHLKENNDKETHEKIPINTPKKITSKQVETNKRENEVHNVNPTSVQKQMDEHKKNEVKKEVNVTNKQQDWKRRPAWKLNSDSKTTNMKKVSNEDSQKEDESLKTRETDMAEHKRLYEEYKRMTNPRQYKKEEECNSTSNQEAEEQNVYTSQNNKEPEKKSSDATKIQEIRKASKPDSLPKEPLKRPEIIALQKEELGGVSPRQRKKSLSQLEQGEAKDQASRAITPKQNEEQENSPKSSRGSTPTKQLKKQPSRDVPLQINHREREDYGGTPVLQISLRVGSLSSLASDNGGGRQSSLDMPGSPTRRSRKTSREERPPSRESDRGTRGGTPVTSSHRRPSRDVPLNPAQVERLAAASDLASPEPVLPQTQAWPDLIVATQGENAENLHDYRDSLNVPVATLMKSPSGTLLSVPGVTVSQADKPIMDVPSSPILNQDTKEDNTCTAEDDSAYVSSNKLVAWILDIGNNQVKPTPSLSTSNLVNQWESRDSSPRLTPSPSRDRSPRPGDRSLQPRDRSPLPTGRMGDKSPAVARPQPPLQPLSREASSENLCIQTPWGTLKRSPSRSTLSKSPSFEVPSTNVGEMIANGRSSRENLSIKSDDGLLNTMTRSPSPRVMMPRLQKQEAVEEEDSTNSQPCLRVRDETPPRPPEKNKETYKYETEDIDIRNIATQEDSKSHTLPRSSKLMKQRSSDCLNSYDKKREIKRPPPIDTKKANEESNSQSLKRKSKFPPSPNQKKKIGPMLFSAQDRISQFEQKPTSSSPPQRPITRTRSNVVLTLSSDRPSCDVNKTGMNGARVSDKTQIGYLRTRLLDKVGKTTPTLPEESLINGTPNRNITKNRPTGFGVGRPTILR